jgi:hypothetical protein
LRRIIPACAGLLACACLAATAVASTPSATRTITIERQALATAGRTIDRYQQETWRWQRLMGRPLTETAGRTLAKLSSRDVRQAVLMWQRRAKHARLLAHRPPHLREFLCIHRFEGSWSDAGSPYYGGLQMSLTFQAHYGGWLLRSKGTADHWTPLEQIWVAERAYDEGRGYWPWPNTARDCGLI